MGSYAESIKGIIVCARKTQYKSLFSNIKVVKGRPVIINDQPIYSWKNIIKRFIDEDKYKCLMDRVFIAVSKRCCYLCELYINFAIKQGYNIVISGKHGKIYKKKLEYYTRVNYDSSSRNSPNPFDDSDIDDGDDEFMEKYTHLIEKLLL
ncbi:unnamed protein product [Rhizophagus irregularis]|nr:unnamed protein product [Rhizophagus irregularis]